MIDFEEWRSGQEEAKRLWLAGAPIKSIAAALKVAPGRASEICRQWERTALRDRISQAAFLLSEAGFSFHEISVVVQVSEDHAESLILSEKKRRGLLPPVEDVDLELSIKASKALDRLGAKTTADVCELTEATILRLDGCGRKTLNEIITALSKKGLRLTNY
tara:strand:- start:2803 stop:3288 length:486 start_codon:yes stop_codon:yes gene_type:complete